MAPIIGAPDAIAKQIQQEFTGAVEKQRVSVTTSKDERADYTLRGYIVAAKDKNATKVSYIWDITDPTGKRVNRITGEEVVSGSASKDPWAAMTPAVAQSIAGKAANSFVTWLPSQAASSAGRQQRGIQPAGVGAQPAGGGRRRDRKRARLQPAGRPGRIGRRQVPPHRLHRPDHGQHRAATSAVTAVVPRSPARRVTAARRSRPPSSASCPARAVAVADKPTTAAYRVEGTVTVGQAEEGKQPIQIEWMVRDPQGKKLGTVSQKNEIPEGSLDGAWGPDRRAGRRCGRARHLKLLPQAKAVN